MKSRPATFTSLFCPSLLSENSSIPSSEFNNSLAKSNVNRLRLSATWINIVCECGSLSLSLSVLAVWVRERDGDGDGDERMK